jgi:hypothetical protein
MAVDPLLDALRPVFQQLVEEKITTPDSVVLKVYDDALDRIEKYLRRIFIVCIAFLSIIGSILAFVGWSSLTQIRKDFEESADTKLKQIQASNDKSRAEIDKQAQQINKSTEDILNRRQEMDKQWNVMSQQQNTLQAQLQLYIQQVGMVTTDVPPEKEAAFDQHMKAFWEYGRSIGLFDHPLTKIEIVRAFTVDPSIKAGFSISGDGSLLKVASVFIISEQDLLSQLILGRLADLNTSVKQFRSRRIADFDQLSIELNPTMEAINAISRALSKYLTAVFLKQTNPTVQAARNAPTGQVAGNVDDVVTQWVGVFGEYQSRVQGQPGLEHYSVVPALVKVWREIDIETEPRIDPSTFIGRLADAAAATDAKNSIPLMKVGDELSAYYESHRPDLASAAPSPTGNR